MRYLTFAVLFVVAACAPQYSEEVLSSPAGRKCQYEASAATVNMPGLLDGAVEQNHLFRLCLEANR